MADPVVVQSVEINSGFSGDFDDPVTIGNTIVMAVSEHTGDGVISDPLYDGSPVDGAEEIVQATDDGSDNNAVSSIWILPNVQTSGTSLSITQGGFSGDYVGIIAYEVENLGTSPVVVQSNSFGEVSDGSADQTITASDTSSAAGNFVIASIVQDGAAGANIPVGSPWTSVGLPGNTGLNSSAGYLITEEAGDTLTYDGGSGFANWSAVIAEIAPGSGSVTGTADVTLKKMTVSGDNFTDDFHRSNNTDLGANWTPFTWSGSSPIPIVSDVAAGVTSFTAGEFWNAATFNDDQTSEVTVSTVPTAGNQWVGVTVRQSGDGGNGYLFIYYTGSGSPEFMLFAENGTSSPPLLDSTSATMSDGDTLKISVIGTTITCYHNDTQVVAATDATYTSGAPGFAFFGGDARVSAWAGNNNPKWNVLQSIGAATFVSGNTTSLTLDSNVSSGSKLICYLAYGSGAISSIQDGNGNDFTQKISVAPSFTNVDVWELDTPSGDVSTTPTITVTLSSSSQSLDWVVQEVAGLASTADSLDGTPVSTGTNAANAGTYTSPSYSSTAANEYLFSIYAASFAFSGNSNWTAPSGYIADPNSDNNDTLTLGVAYKSSSAGAESAVWSDTCATSNFAQTIVLGSFKLASTGVTGTADVTLKKITAAASGATSQLIFKRPSSPATLFSDTAAATLGIQFSAAAVCAVNAVWWYSASGAASLPGTIAIFAVSGQSLVHSETASWSGSAGSGWVRAAFSSPPSLAASAPYKACILNTSPGGNWYAATANYWTSGAGSSGITSGILTAPNAAGSDGGQDTYHHPGSSLGYPASNFNDSNYWIDVEVVPLSSGAVTLKKMTAAASGGVKVTGSVAVTLKKMTAAASGGVKVTGSVAVTLKKMTVSGSGHASLLGTGAVTLKKMIVSGSGSSGSSVTGTAAVTLKKMTVSGSGHAPLLGTGAVTLKKMTVSSSGSVKVIGIGSVAMHKMQVHGMNIPASKASSLFIFSFR